MFLVILGIGELGNRHIPHLPCYPCNGEPAIYLMFLVILEIGELGIYLIFLVILRIGELAIHLMFLGILGFSELTYNNLCKMRIGCNINTTYYQ